MCESVTQIYKTILGNELHLEKYSSQAGKSTNLERFMIEKMALLANKSSLTPQSLKT